MVSILRVWQRHRRLHVKFGVVWLLLMALPGLGHAEQPPSVVCKEMQAGQPEAEGGRPAARRRAPMAGAGQAPPHAIG